MMCSFVLWYDSCLRFATNDSWLLKMFLLFLLMMVRPPSVVVLLAVLASKRIELWMSTREVEAKLRAESSSLKREDRCVQYTHIQYKFVLEKRQPLINHRLGPACITFCDHHSTYRTILSIETKSVHHNHTCTSQVRSSSFCPCPTMCPRPRTLLLRCDLTLSRGEEHFFVVLTRCLLFVVVQQARCTALYTMRLITCLNFSDHHLQPSS